MRTIGMFIAQHRNPFLDYLSEKLSIERNTPRRYLAASSDYYHWAFSLSGDRTQTATADAEFRALGKLAQFDAIAT